MIARLIPLGIAVLLGAASLVVSGCSSGGGSPALTTSAASTIASIASTPSTPQSASSRSVPKSAKRGLAYDIASTADLHVLAPGITWWYNWSPAPNSALPANAPSNSGVEFDPMLWNGNFNAASIEQFFAAHPKDKYLLVLNEPNVSGQAYMTPQAAAALWPQYEAVAAAANVKLVGPAITWGTMPNYQDPVAWLDAFYAAYEQVNNGRQPRIDYLAFHWYDYGLASQLDRLDKYNKPIWVTEFANWHSQNDGAQITTLAEQETQMSEMVATCESRSDVFRYAWFTGRISPDPHFESILGAPGQLTALGQEYLTLPHS